MPRAVQQGGSSPEQPQPWVEISGPGVAPGRTSAGDPGAPSMPGFVPASSVMGELAGELGGTGLGSQAMDSWRLVEWAQKRTAGRSSVQVQSPLFSLQSIQHAPPATSPPPTGLASARPCLCPACPALPTALPTQEVISCCLAHAPVLRQRASAREALQDPHLCLCVCGWGYLVAGRLPLQTAVFLRAEHRPAWLLSLPHRPGCPWPPAEDVALGAPRSPHRQVAVSWCREPGFSAAVPEALWGAEWDFQRSCFWLGKMFGDFKGQALE